jgi:hypothetical protein
MQYIGLILQVLDEASIHNGTALTSGVTALSEVAVFSQTTAAGKLKPFIAIAAIAREPSVDFHQS